MFTVEMFFDPVSERKIRGLWDALARAGLPSEVNTPGNAPHLTLAIYDRLDKIAAVDCLRHFAGKLATFPLGLASVGSFPGESGAVFLAPVVTAGLLALHAGLHDCLAAVEHEGAWEHYLPGAWVPHCTVALRLPDPEAVAEAFALVRRQFSPYAIEVQSLGVMEYNPPQRHCRYDLTLRPPNPQERGGHWA